MNCGTLKKSSKGIGAIIGGGLVAVPFLLQSVEIAAAILVIGLIIYFSLKIAR